MTLRPEDLERQLPIKGFGRPLYFFTSIGSSNDYAKELAEQGAPHGTLVVADEQTAGRGRAGRSWSTPAGTALALSVVLRSLELAPPEAARLNGLGPLAVTEAIEARRGEALVKWPNDVLLQGRKVAGVLVETAWEDDRLAYAVIGIGVNVHRGSAPTDEAVALPASDLESTLGRRLDRGELLIDILGSLAGWVEALESRRIMDAWQSRLAFRGEMVAAEGPGGELRGELVGLAEDGRIKLRGEDGKEQVLGPEVRRLRALKAGID